MNTVAFVLHLSNLITYEKDKGLFNACRNTLEIRGDDGMVTDYTIHGENIASAINVVVKP